MASAKTLARELVNMRRTVGKLAVNKASFMALSNQMTEQLGERGGRGWAQGGCGCASVFVSACACVRGPTAAPRPTPPFLQR